MSGIEVAGVVLAVFPLVVKGISEFADGAQTVRYWRRCRAQLEDYRDIIESQKVAYLDTLEELLEEIVQSDDELRLLLSEPEGPAWRRSDYDKMLRQRLDRSYNAYIRLIKDMRDGLTKLRERLGIDENGKVSNL